MNPTVRLFIAICLAAASSNVNSQVNVCGNLAACSTAGGVKTCTEMWTALYQKTITNVITTGAATSCVPATGLTATPFAPLTFTAMRPTTAPPTGGCRWSGLFGTFAGSFFCDDLCGPETGPGSTDDCEADLPVELLDFSVIED